MKIFQSLTALTVFALVSGDSVFATVSQDTDAKPVARWEIITKVRRNLRQATIVAQKETHPKNAEIGVQGVEAPGRPPGAISVPLTVSFDDLIPPLKSNASNKLKNAPPKKEVTIDKGGIVPGGQQKDLPKKEVTIDKGGIVPGGQQKELPKKEVTIDKGGIVPSDEKKN